MRSENAFFDYVNCCIICGNTAEINRIKDPVCEVSSPGFAAEILKLLEQLRTQTDESLALKNRLSLQDNLIEKKARYHRKCRTNLFNNSVSSGNKVGRPRDSNIYESMYIIFDFIEDSEIANLCMMTLKSYWKKKGKLYYNYQQLRID